MTCKICSHAKIFPLLIFFLFCLFFIHTPAFSYPINFTDAQGNDISIKEGPLRVVSLVPSITEIIFKIGAGDAVKGITYHTTYLPETSEKEIIGGFSSPSLIRIEEMNPDVIFYSHSHKMVTERFANKGCQLINLETDSIVDSYKNILLLGSIFNREKEAFKIVNEIKQQLQIISKKVAKIPASKRKRVMRLMGHDEVMTPGDDSFQNEMIRAAGGIPPVLNKKGQIVPITREEWIRYNPQIIYGCGRDSETVKKFLNLSGWKDVEAVKHGDILFFPCDLTCRAATNTGYFVSWLSARINRDDFSNKEKQIFNEEVFKSRRLDMDLDYIAQAHIAYSHIHDFINKTLIVDFKEPLSIVSTLQGQREGIESVGNHYSPPPCWSIGHKQGLKEIRARVYQVIGRSEDTASFLFTGADMDYLSIKHQRYKDMAVYALVTGGVVSNALRTSKDVGNYYEPGTINIILLPNMKLTSRAMTRAIITATEAKTAALLDMDIRSSYSPRFHRATGTGTDNIIAVQGSGIRIDNSGGHTKMGELIAKAVYEGVQEAVYKQNGLIAKRNVFQRIKDRRISVSDLIVGKSCEWKIKKSDLAGATEEILLDPRYAGFVKSSLALSDEYEKGLLIDLSAYKLWCKKIAEEIAGREIASSIDFIVMDDLPVVLRMAFNAILNGVYYKSR